LVAFGAGDARLTVDCLDRDLLQVLEFVDEARWPGEAGVDPDAPAGPGQCDVEKATLLRERIVVGGGHRDLQDRVVLDLARKTAVTTDSIEQEDVLRLQAVRYQVSSRSPNRRCHGCRR
jgi:hypothetical protein